MGSYTLKIQGYDSAELINLSKAIYDSFRVSEFIEKSDTNNEITLKNDFFSNDYRVPNVCRYRLIKTDTEEYKLLPNDTKNVYSSAFNDIKIDERFIEENKLPTIILILESPHKDEYNPEFKPIAPAQKDTGNKINEMFIKIIKLNLSLLDLKKDEYRILIINPIPFQTSLNFLTKTKINPKLRDDVWKTLWKNESHYKIYLTKTITKISPEIILNCCTKKLSKEINSYLKSKFSTIRKFQINHPSSWNVPNVNQINIQ